MVVWYALLRFSCQDVLKRLRLFKA